MTYSSTDPRNVIRQKIGTKKLIDDTEQYCIVVSSNFGNINVPLLLSEELKVESIQHVPYITFRLMDAT